MLLDIPGTRLEKRRPAIAGQRHSKAPAEPLSGQVMKALFHLAYHVTDLQEARRFYGDVLGCKEGRSTETWVDFDFFGHQLSLHLGEPFPVTRTGKVGDHMVMMPHLGAVLPLDDWFVLAERLEKAGIGFDIPPVVRFEGEPGEQRTMFFFDPSGNPIEVKGFRDFESVFAQ
jgi:extradiol dioxygenase family protein